MESKKRVLTVPDDILDRGKIYVTGNEYVSLPNISENCEIRSFNVLHMGIRGLVEFAGSPIIAPYVEIGGKMVEFGAKKCELVDSWIPTFEAKCGGVQTKTTIFAPPNYHGFVCVLSIKNDGRKKCFVGLRGRWEKTLQTVYRARLLNALNCVEYYRWTKGLSFETRAGAAISAFTIGTEEFDTCDYSANSACAVGKNKTGEIRLQNDGTNYVEYIIGRHVEPGNDWVHVPFYVGVAIERDGASVSMVDLKRHGWEELLEYTRKELAAKSKKIPDKKLNEVMNRNLLFNYFYATGRTIDTDQLALVTSRSPAYYVSAAFWARDALWWSFPGILLSDKAAARKMLLEIYTTYMRNPGIHSLYIDGNVLYPGFELDEVCVYVTALETYLKETKDHSMLDEKCVVDGLRQIENLLWSKKHPRKYLFETFLDSCDDPVEEKYVTYDNVLVWRTFAALGWFEELKGNKSEKYAAFAKKVKDAIMSDCIAETKHGKIFAYSTDADGKYWLGEKTPGSLVVLPYLGFCSANDPIYKNTLNWIYSTENKYYNAKGRFKGLGNEHSPHTWPMAACNALLAGVRTKESLELLKEAPMDNGIACETVDENCGEIRTGAAFATFAGYLGYSIWHHFNKAKGRRQNWDGD